MTLVKCTTIYLSNSILCYCALKAFKNFIWTLLLVQRLLLIAVLENIFFFQFLFV